MFVLLVNVQEWELHCTGMVAKFLFVSKCPGIGAALYRNGIISILFSTIQLFKIQTKFDWLSRIHVALYRIRPYSSSYSLLFLFGKWLSLILREWPVFGWAFSVSTSARLSLSQPMCLNLICAAISYLECFHVCLSYVVSLIKTIINYCYWQFGWILFDLRNIHINALAEAESDILGILWFSLSQNMKCLYFMNETISSQIASSNS